MSTESSEAPSCVSVAVVEFDIDRGSVVRLQRPRPVPVAFHCQDILNASPQSVGTPGIGPSWSSYLTDQLIPDGTERYDFALTWLALNRPAPSRRLAVMTSLFSAATDGSWECAARFCALIIENGVLSLVDCQGRNSPLRLPVGEVSHHPMPCSPPPLPPLPSDPPAKSNGRSRRGTTASGANNDDGNQSDDGSDDRVFVMLKSKHSVAAVLFASSSDFEAFSVRVASLQAAGDDNSGQEGTVASSDAAGQTESPTGSPTRSEPGRLTGDDAPLYALSCAMTKKDASVRRGSINKGVAVFSDRVEWLHCLVPLLEVAVDALCCVRGWSEEAQSVQEAIVDELVAQINDVVLPRVRELTASREKLGLLGAVKERCLQDRSHNEARVTVDKSVFYRHLTAPSETPVAATSAPDRSVTPSDGGSTAPTSPTPGAERSSPPPPQTSESVESPKLRTPTKDKAAASAAARTQALPVCNAPQQVSNVPARLTVSALPSRAVDTNFRVPVVVELFDAIGADLPRVVLAAALDKRVMVLARHIVATRVSNACVAIGAPLLSFDPMALARRVFPYSGITSTSHFEGRDGYIVGTLNPIFESTKPKRWWDLLVDIERKELTSTDAEIAAVTDRLADPLAAAGRRLAACIGRQRAVGGNDVVAVEFECRAALVEMLQQCLALAATDENATVCAPLLRSRIGTAWSLGKHGSRDARPSWWVQLADCPQEDPNALVSVLQRGLRSTSTADELYSLLLTLPGGSVEPLGELLLHRDPVVVLLAVALMRRIDADPVGRQCVSQLNSFLLFTFEQLKREVPDTSS